MAALKVKKDFQNIGVWWYSEGLLKESDIITGGSPAEPPSPSWMWHLLLPFCLCPTILPPEPPGEQAKAWLVPLYHARENPPHVLTYQTQEAVTFSESMLHKHLKSYQYCPPKKQCKRWDKKSNIYWLFHQILLRIIWMYNQRLLNNL